MTGSAFRVVERHADLEQVCATLAGAERLYLDTEFDSRRDGSQLCLVQVSRGAEVFLIDALRLRTLQPLGQALGHRATEWVLHAGAQDVPLLVRALKLDEPQRVFDTQAAWALMSAEYSVSLAYLQFRVLGIRSVKTHQADDWKRRPLPKAQLAYAADDVRHLPALRTQLAERAARLGRLHLVHEVSHELLGPPAPPAETVSLSSFRNAWQLDRPRQAALRFIVSWYNELDPGQRSEAPDAKALLSIARRLPEDADALARIKGIPRRWCARHGDRFAAELVRAARNASQEDFMPIDPPPYATFPELRLDAWLQTLRAEVCASVGVAPELAFPSRLLRRARARMLERSDAQALATLLDGWRKEMMAAACLAYCERTPPPLVET